MCIVQRELVQAGTVEGRGAGKRSTKENRNRDGQTDRMKER